LIVVAAFEAPTVVAGLNDVTVMSQPVEQRGGHLGVAEHAWPFAKCKVGGDDDGSSLVEPADEMEQKLAAGLGKGQISEFVESCRALHESTYVESAFMWSDLSGLIAGTASRVFDST